MPDQRRVHHLESRETGTMIRLQDGMADVIFDGDDYTDTVPAHDLQYADEDDNA